MKLKPYTTLSEVEDLAEQLHRDFRAAFKALHTGRNKPGHIGVPKNCINEHDHGWSKCHRKNYFRHRAQRQIETKRAKDEARLHRSSLS